MTKENIVNELKQIKSKYAKDGFFIVGLFGSVARDEQDDFSDIDIAYRIDYDKFSQKFKDGFSKILKIEETKEELEQLLQRRVDLVSLNSNNSHFLSVVESEIIDV